MKFLSCRPFSGLLFLHVHRETVALVNELREESDQFQFLHVSCLANLKESVCLILAKVSDMRISIPLIPLLCFIRSRCLILLLFLKKKLEGVIVLLCV